MNTHAQKVIHTYIHTQTEVEIRLKKIHVIHIIGRFVGMVPSEQLQQYLVRAVTGFGDRVQQELTDKDFDDLTSKIANLAGSIIFYILY